MECWSSSITRWVIRVSGSGYSVLYPVHLPAITPFPAMAALDERTASLSSPNSIHSSGKPAESVPVPVFTRRPISLSRQTRGGAVFVTHLRCKKLKHRVAR
jgi:hypothetical protein